MPHMAIGFCVRYLTFLKVLSLSKDCFVYMRDSVELVGAVGPLMFPPSKEWPYLYSRAVVEPLNVT